jgi:hypothetical protein
MVARGASLALALFPSLAVRFCYESCDSTTRNGRLKTSSPTLRVDAGQHLDHTGYMVFPGPGLMRFSVTDSSGATATVVIEVP